MTAGQEYIKGKYLLQWIGHFDGTKPSYVRWAEDCDRVFKEARGADIRYILGIIKRTVRNLGINLYDLEDIETWETLKNKLNALYRVESNPDDLFARIINMSRKGTVFDYYNELLGAFRDYKRAINNLEKSSAIKEALIGHAEGTVFSNFLRNIPDPFKMTVIALKPKDINDAYNLLNDLELKSGRGSYSEESGNFPRINRLGDDPASLVCQWCHNTGHSAPNCLLLKDHLEEERKRKDQERSSHFYDPSSSKQRTHYPHLEQHEPFGNRRYINAEPSSHPFVYDKQQHNPTLIHSRSNNYSFIDGPHRSNELKYDPRIVNQVPKLDKTVYNHYVLLAVNGVTKKALLDSGAQLNLIKMSSVPINMINRTPININGISGSITTIGTVNVPIEIGGSKGFDLFHVVEDQILGNYDLYLGTPFFVASKCSINYDNLTLSK